MKSKDVYSPYKFAHFLPKLKSIKKGEIASPVNMQIDLTNKCTNKCIWCYYLIHEHLDDFSTQDIIPYKDAIRILSQFKGAGGKSVEFSLKGDELIPLYTDQDGLTLKPIQEVIENKIEKNSFTIQDNGNVSQDAITDFIKHKQTEPLWKVTLDSGRHITVTKSHSIFFWEKGKITYKPLKEAKIGDKVVLSNEKYPTKHISINSDWARLLGYFVAEGCFSFQRKHVPHGIHFTFGFNAQEQKYISDVANILTTNGYKAVIRKFDNKTKISVCNKELTEDFLKLGIGEGSRNKRVPDCIFNANKSAQINFLTGLFAGDGNFRDTLYRQCSRNSLHLKTSSVLLQRTVEFLLSQLDIWCTLYEGINCPRSIEGRSLPETTYCTVNIQGKDELLKLESIIKFMGKELKYKDSKYSHTTKHKKIEHISENVIVLPIKKIEEVDKEKYVYDISVGESHRFISSFGILCHNTGGGEPLLHPNFIDISSHARDLNLERALVTNGQLLTEPYAEEVSDYAWVRVSLDSATEESYAKIHCSPKENFHKVLRNIKLYMTKKQPDCVFGISAIADENNAGELSQIAEIAKDLGADNLRISLAHTPKKGSIFENCWDTLLEEIDKAKSLEDDSFKVFSFSNRIAEIERKSKGGFCYYHHLTTAVGANGAVYPCCYFKYINKYNLGNLHENSFEEIWNGDTRKDFIDNVACDCTGSCWMVEKNAFCRYLMLDETEIPHLNFP